MTYPFGWKRDRRMRSTMHHYAQRKPPGEVEQESGVVLEEQEVAVVVEPVVEAKWWEECFIGFSTPFEVNSIEVVAGHEGKMNENELEYGMGMDKTTEEVWTKKDEQGGPKKVYEWIGWGYNKLGMSLASLTVKVWVHVASFG